MAHMAASMDCYRPGVDAGFDKLVHLLTKRKSASITLAHIECDGQTYRSRETRRVARGARGSEQDCGLDGAGEQVCDTKSTSRALELIQQLMMPRADRFERFTLR